MLAATAIAGAVKITDLAANNAKTDGVAAVNVIAAELGQSIVAEGRMKLENPTDLIGYYGYDNDGPLTPAVGRVQSKDNQVEATKTEPDKNTYLILADQNGADAAYNYGTHFVFQGHENGVVKDGQPILFHDGQIDADATSQAVKD